MKYLKNKFDKHAIPDLPKANFGGRIITIVSEQEADRAVEYLMSQPILGFDTETKPRFQSGKGSYKVALLQVSTPDTCFLFRLNQIGGIPPSVIRLLSDTTITKVGLSWHDDLMMLHRRAEFQTGTFVEIQEMVKTIGIQDLSLQKIFANLFGKRISKTQRLSNWEADVLSVGQELYAATDAWACIEIYNELKRLHDTQDFEMEIVPEPEPVVPEKKKEEEPDKQEKPAKAKVRRKYNRPKRKYKKPAKENITSSNG